VHELELELELLELLPSSLELLVELEPLPSSLELLVELELLVDVVELALDGCPVVELLELVSLELELLEHVAGELGPHASSSAVSTTMTTSATTASACVTSQPARTFAPPGKIAPLQ
jgi:hypothetical protein